MNKPMHAAAGAIAVLTTLGGAPAGAPPTLPGQTSAGAFAYFDEPFDYDRAVPPPASVIGHEIGEHFTRHGELLRYAEALDAASDRVRMERYGASHQRRPLFIWTISSPENLERLDDILDANAALADPERTSRNEARAIIRDNPAIVWLSYSVHGNEASCTETAIQAAYTLAAARDPEVRRWLDEVVVVIDPCLNPDGRERYITWYENTAGMRPDAAPESAEHDEPWPGGRSNHYYFDLNRDWVWAVHPESASRLEVYRRFRPQVHIDNHEQGYTAPYFFGAGDTPYHAAIPQPTKAWIERYGDRTAVTFDRHGLPFFTKERFDYLYPGYGKVLPVYHGAIGMLTEQAGHSRGGLAIRVDDNYTLTLRERARNHFLTAMTTVEVTADHRAKQLERFHAYFRTSMAPEDGTPRAYFIDADNDPWLLGEVKRICDAHGVRIERLSQAARVSEAQGYLADAPLSIELPAGTWVIPADQPMGRLVRALFELDPHLEDKDTYDITAWSLPAVFGLDAWFTLEPFDAPTSPLSDWSPRPGVASGDGEVALLVDPSQHRFPHAAALVERHSISALLAGKPFEMDGRSFPAGTLIAYRVRNDAGALARFEADLLGAGLDVHHAASSAASAGPSLASGEHRRLTTSRILLVRGEGISSLGYGHVWHLMDLVIPMDYSSVNLDALGRTDLDAYDVVVLPSGSGLRGRAAESVESWVRAGGTLVALGASASWASRAMLELELDDHDDEDDRAGEEYAGDEPEAQGEPDAERRPLNELTYGERYARSVEDRVPGSLLKVRLDRTHPLAFGLRGEIAVLQRSARRLPVGERGYAVGRYAPDPSIAGYISERNASRLAGEAWLTHHRLGRGSVVCLAEDPAIRGFPQATMRLFLNAAVMGSVF